VPSVCVNLFVYEISREPLNGFSPNSHGRPKTCLDPRLDKFEGQGQMSKVKVIRYKKRHFSALSAACVRFVFGTTSVASSCMCIQVSLETL